MQQNKLVYLDGLKGFGCVCVFLTHFVFAFYYGMYHYQLEACHLPDNLDIVIGKSPLNLLFNRKYSGTAVSCDQWLCTVQKFF